eukprot:scaffold98994_cov63-Phaeocystis_antarctica.AAC.5
MIGGRMCSDNPCDRRALYRVSKCKYSRCVWWRGAGNLAAAASASDLRGRGQVEALGLGAVGMKALDPRGAACP